MYEYYKMNLNALVNYHMKYLNLSIVNDFYGSVLCNQYSNYGKKVKQFKWNDEMIELMFEQGVIVNDRTIDEAFGSLRK